MRGRRVAAVLAFAALHGPASAQEPQPNPALVPPASLHEQVLHFSGDPDRPVDLLVTVYLPEGPGPFPLAIMNHGANGSTEKPADSPRYRFTMAAYYFLSRGYAVALPMMRGYGGSGGTPPRHGCDLADIALDNGRDLAGLISSIGTDPQIDTSRVVVAGQSFGGWNTLGLGAVEPARVRGLVSFSGGVKTSGCRTEADGFRALIAAADRLGAATRVPSIWFFGENDTLFPVNVWQAMHAAYAGAGAPSELVDVGVFMSDSHQMLSFPEVFPILAARLDPFLERIGMPHAPVQPAYAPVPVPPPTRFANVDDVNAVPWLNDTGRAAYRIFLEQKLPRAFVLGLGGQNISAHGGFDPLGRALQTCQAAHVPACTVYAVDNDVVYAPPPVVARPPATSFAAIDDVSAVPWIDDKGRAAYRNFLNHPPPRAFVLGTGGEHVSIVTSTDPLSDAMAACAKVHIECRPYAIDNDVVWVKPPPAPVLWPTHFAPIGAIDAVPWLNAHGREAYAHFLTLNPPRAFLIAPGGQSATTHGGYDPVGRGLALCSRAGLSCVPYAVDNQVVFRRPRG